MERDTTPTPARRPRTPGPPSTPAVPTTPAPSATPRARTLSTSTSNATPRVQRNTPMPSTPGSHRQIPSVPQTPATGTLACSSAVSAFNRLTVRTAKCSECDSRNKGTMMRCPGCTFQVCEACAGKRERAGRGLAHGNMLNSQTVSEGEGGSVVRRRPSLADQGGRKRRFTEDENEEDSDREEMRERRRTTKPKPKAKAKSRARARAREETPSDLSSEDDVLSDPASPTANKRRRTDLTSKIDGATDPPSPALRPAEQDAEPSRLGLGGSSLSTKDPRDMTMDELLAHHGVNTPENPYEAHLLSRHEPVVSNPVIAIPELVKRGFKPRATAEEIQKNIQDKVREKLGQGGSSEGTKSDG